jgi:hypothetical protein
VPAAPVGEGSLTVWLLTVGVNVPKWAEQAARPASLQPHGS